MGYKRNIASNFATQISISVLSFLVSVIVARVFGTEGKGEIAYILLVFTTIGQYGHMGITYATPYFSKKTKFTSNEVFNNNFTYILCTCILLTIIILVGKIFGLILNEYNYFTVFLGIVMFIFTMIAEFLSTVYISHERIIELNKITLTSNIIKLSLIFLLWIIKLLNFYTYLIVLVLPLIYNSLFLGIKVKEKLKLGLNKLLLHQEFKFGITIYLATLFIFMNYKIDQFFINFMLGKSELGIYSVAVSLAELLFLIPGSVASAILGRLYNMKNSNQQERTKVTSNTIKITFYVTLILMFIGIMCTPIIPLIYGERYRGAMVPTIILFVGILFASIGKISSSYFQSSGEPKIHLYITFSVFLVNIILNLYLIPRNGIIGAALASSVSYLVYGISYIVIFIKKEKFTFEGLFLFSKDERESVKNSVKKVFRR